MTLKQRRLHCLGNYTMTSNSVSITNGLIMPTQKLEPKKDYNCLTVLTELQNTSIGSPSPEIQSKEFYEESKNEEEIVKETIYTNELILNNTNSESNDGDSVGENFNFNSSCESVHIKEHLSPIHDNLDNELLSIDKGNDDDTDDSTNINHQSLKTLIPGKSVNSTGAQNDKEMPLEELLGSLTTFNPQGGQDQALRTSARVIKKLRLDSLQNPIPCGESLREKRVGEHLKLEDREKLDGKPKVRSQKAQWSVAEKSLFFEGLNEYGKDIDAITQFLANKLRRRGIGESLVKTKDQVRHFYYRTWHKISKYIKFSSGIKKVVQELYALINYGEIRKKLFCLNEKTSFKLSELIYRGSVQLKVKGKNIRVKTPMCKALRRLNQMEECQEELKLPTKVTVELKPKTIDDWSRVQIVAHNPRVMTALPLQRRLSTLITTLSDRWKPRDLKAREKLFDCYSPDEGDNEDSNLIKMECNSNKDPRLHFIPKPGISINRPVVNLSEYLTSYRICLNSYKERLGLDIESEVQHPGCLTSFKGGGVAGGGVQRKTAPKRQRTESSGDKKPFNELTENESKKMKFIDDNFSVILSPDNCDIKNPPETELVLLHSVQSENECTNSNPDEPFHTDSLENYDTMQQIFALEDKGKDSSDEYKIDDDNYDDDKKSIHEYDEDLKLGKDDKLKNKVKYKLLKRKEDLKKCEKWKIEHTPDTEASIRQGWTAEEAAGLTIGELYLMFGNESRLQMEYWWEYPPYLKKQYLEEKEVVTENISCDNIPIFTIEETCGESQLPLSTDQNENIALKSIDDYDTIDVRNDDCDIVENGECNEELFRDEVIPSETLDLTNVQNINNSEDSEDKSLPSYVNLTGRLKKLLEIAMLNDKYKLPCSCGHICGDRGSAISRKAVTTKKILDRNEMPSVASDIPQQSFVSTKTISAINQDTSNFRSPLPVIASNNSHNDPFKAQLNSLQQIKSRWGIRRGRGTRSKVVVQRMLPLLPNGSSNEITTMKVSPQIDNIPNNVNQQKIVTPRQLSFSDSNQPTSTAESSQNNSTEYIKCKSLTKEDLLHHDINLEHHHSIISDTKNQNNINNRQTTILMTINNIPLDDNGKTNIHDPIVTQGIQVTSHSNNLSEDVDKNSVGGSSSISNLLDFSLPSGGSIDISLGVSAIAEEEANFVGLIDKSAEVATAASITSLSPSRLLNNPDDNSWFNSEIHDFSLSSFLGHLESPVKQTPINSGETSIPQNADANLQFTMGDTSIDFVTQFRALADEMANETTKS